MLIRLRRALMLALLSTGVAFGAPNKPPTVVLTSPTSGATFAAPANITLSANASDSDGTITRVEFIEGGVNSLGTRTSPPYSMTWSNVTAGSYSLTATAIDNAGGIKTSSKVSITVTGAKLFIAAPVNGATVYGSSVTVSGTYSGDPASTTVLVDNGNTTRAATISGNAYSTSLPIYYGPNTVRVTVNRRDKTSDSAIVTVTGNGDPLLIFTGPTATVFDAPANMTLAVDAVSPAGAISKVEFFRDGTLLGTSTSPPYQFPWSNVGSGSYTVSAKATDTAGHAGFTGRAITVNGPNIPPTVSLTAPTSGANFTAPATIAMTANANDADGTVTKVEFLQNGVVVGVTNIAPYGMTWSNVVAGSYTLTARATDDRGGVTTSSPVAISVGPANAPPTVSLTAPANGSSFAAPATIALAASASDSDGTVTRVDFYQGATLIGGATSAPYGATWANVAAGNYAITARATDNRGAVTVSAPVNVVVSPNSPPTVSLTAPAANASFFAPATIALTATASDSDGSIARVDFYQGATLIGSATSAPYTANWTDVPAGPYALTARATDNAGAVATSAVVNITVSALSFAIVSPANNATINDNLINVSGTLQAPANAGVTVNGIVAAIYGSNFYANNVGLTGGANTITATLTAPDGTIASQTISVTSTGSSPVRVTADTMQGLSPLIVTFDVTWLDGVAIQKVEVDADGNGTVDQTLLAFPWTSITTYIGAGAVMTTFHVTDTQGNVYTQVIPIVVTDRATLDQNLRAVWNGMKSALAAGDKARAMQYLDASAQQRYGPVFDVLLSSMPQITATFSDLQSVTLSDGLGEYAVNRIINGENRIYLIYFGRNGDGVWRLGSM
jgi:hypothetical protein